MKALRLDDYSEFRGKHKKRRLLDFSDSDSDFEPVKPKVHKPETNAASSSNAAQCIDLTVAQCDGVVLLALFRT